MNMHPYRHSRRQRQPNPRNAMANYDAPHQPNLFELFANSLPPPLDAFEPTPIRENAHITTLDTSRIASVLDAAFEGLKNPLHSFSGNVAAKDDDSDDDLFKFFDYQGTTAFKRSIASADPSSIFAPAIDAALVTMGATMAQPDGPFYASADTSAPKPKKRRISADGQPSFRHYQETQWNEQFEELVNYKNRHGNCLVPHHHPENQTLSRWVKRQRYQYKLKMSGMGSTMTDARMKQLEDIDFVWSSHASIWEKRLTDLKHYVEEHGNCDIPMNYPENPDLATWVKCQRRQYKLFWNENKSSSMTLDRMQALDELGFIWNVHEQE